MPAPTPHQCVPHWPFPHHPPLCSSLYRLEKTRETIAGFHNELIDLFIKVRGVWGCGDVGGCGGVWGCGVGVWGCGGGGRGGVGGWGCGGVGV